MRAMSLEVLEKLERKLLKVSKGFIISTIIALGFQSDAILPPFTSRTVKSILGKAGCMESVRKLYTSKGSMKPVTLSPLYRGARPLYVVWRGDKTPSMTVRSGEVLQAAISVYTMHSNELNEVLEDLASCSETVDIGYARVYVEPLEINMVRVEDLGSRVVEQGLFKLVMETPLILSTKVMTPPKLKGSKDLEETRDAYRLLPTPSYIFSYAARLATGLVAGSPDPRIQYVVGRLADLMVAEVDYKVKPETALYGSRRGKPLKVRGVKGYVAYQLLNEKFKGVASKLLALAELMGLGKSRSIGFGRVRVEEFTVKM